MKKLNIVSMLVALFFVSPVLAGEHGNMDIPKHEVVASATAGSLTLVDETDNFNLGLSLDYDYMLIPGVQIGISSELAHVFVDNGADVTALTLLAGPTLNIPMDRDFANAFFVGGEAGLVYADAGGNDATEFAFAFQAGKRFKITDHVTYRPSAKLVKVSGIKSNFIFNFLSVGIYW